MANVLIIGSNRGIGLEMVRLYRARGDQVIAACRTSSSGLRETGAEVVEGIDVTDASAPKKLAAAIGSRRIDVAVIVAGVLKRVDLDKLDDDLIRAQFEVNALGPLRMAAGVRQALASPSKLALITSRMGSIEDNTSGGHYAYRMSKAALNMAARSLSHDLKSAGVAVEVLHPGFVRTDMTGGRGDIDAADAARSLLARIDEMSLEHTGRFRHANGSALPW